MGFEAAGLLLGDADEHHAFFSTEASTLLRGDPLLLVAAEVDDGDVVPVGEDHTRHCCGAARSPPDPW